jgi:hypothetical protein
LSARIFARLIRPFFTRNAQKCGILSHHGPVNA